MSDAIRTALRREISRLEAALAALDGDYTGPAKPRAQRIRVSSADLAARRARVFAAVGSHTPWGAIVKALPDLTLANIAGDVTALVKTGKILRTKEDAHYYYAQEGLRVPAKKARRGKR